MASILFLWVLRRKRFPWCVLILAICGLVGATALSGCGGTGFALPSSTSTITVTGTSGSIAHSATVTLKVN